VIYHDGLDWQRLAAGTSGNVLTTQGAGADPIWNPAVGGGGGANALVGADGITVISGVPTAAQDTISGSRTEWVAASGSLQTQITTNVTDIAALTTSGVAQDVLIAANTALVTTTSGFLQTQLDNDVDSVNSLIDDIDIIGKGEVGVTVEGQNIVVSGTDHLLTVTSGIGYIADDFRSDKQLSVSRQNFTFSRDGGMGNSYLRVGNALNNEIGWVIPRDGTIVAVTSFYVSGPSTKGFEVRRNNDSGSPLFTYTVAVSAAFIDEALNIDIDAGDRLQVFIVSAGANITDVSAVVEVAWRT